MERSTLAEPAELAPQSHDPLAVALANASLLSAGYVMLGRRGLAIGTALGTVMLVTILATVAKAVWGEALVLLWWAALTVHGWYLADRSLRGARLDRVGRQRFVALAVTAPMLLAIALFRFDASRIERDAADARRKGDCSQALAALDRRGVGHRVTDAPLAARGDDTVRACGLTLSAAKEFDAVLAGDTGALDAGLSRLATVLGKLPGHDRLVERVLDAFLDRLPTENACKTTAITDLLVQRRAGGNLLDRAVHAVPQIAPEAIVRCGGDLMAVKDWQQARARYQQLLDQYPDHELAASAKEGIKQATQSIELANVRELLKDSYAGQQPTYCSKPAPYSGAAPYQRNGPNRALLFGPNTTWPHPDNYHYKSKLPGNRLARDISHAVLVICVGDTTFGARVKTCPYESNFAIDGVQDVTFRKVSIPVRVYEVRTGRLLVNTTVQIGGKSCPAVLRWTSYVSVDAGPPSEVYVTPSGSDVRAAFASLINP
jgi:hypothetical protein